MDCCAGGEPPANTTKKPKKAAKKKAEPKKKPTQFVEVDEGYQEDRVTQPFGFTEAMSGDEGERFAEQDEFSQHAQVSPEDVELAQQWGERILFNVFRVDTSAGNIQNSVEAAVQRVAPLGKKVSNPNRRSQDKVAARPEELPPGTTVLDLKRLLRQKFLPEAGMADVLRGSGPMPLNMSLFLDDSILEDETRFWEDHTLLLPVFVTVWLHEESLEDLHDWMASKMADEDEDLDAEEEWWGQN